MGFTSGCSHPSFSHLWRTLLAHLVALHLLHLGSAQLTVVAPNLRVIAYVGQDVVLRCHLSPCKDAWSSEIKWIKYQSSGLVHHYQNGEDLEHMEEYKGRTELLRDGLTDGNLDLRITAVTSSDSGSYICIVQDGDAYAEAVLNLEVSDPFSQINHPWKVALAVVVTLLVVLFVIIAFLLRKQVGQSRKLKRKDAAFVEQDLELKQRIAKLEKEAEKLEKENSSLKEKCEEMAKKCEAAEQKCEAVEKENLSLKEKCEETEKENSSLKKHSEEMDKENSSLKQQCEEMGMMKAKKEKHFVEHELTEESETEESEETSRRGLRDEQCLSATTGDQLHTPQIAQDTEPMESPSQQRNP